jgi:hypothetical protein
VRLEYQVVFTSPTKRSFQAGGFPSQSLGTSN